MKTFKIVSHSNYEVAVEPKRSITVTRENQTPNTFRVGDWAEYDSYNLSYTGIITSITEKTVTIKSYPDCPNLSRNYRLKLETFAWRNWDFNLEEVSKRNHETMMYI